MYIIKVLFFMLLQLFKYYNVHVHVHKEDSLWKDLKYMYMYNTAVSKESLYYDFMNVQQRNRHLQCT